VAKELARHLKRIRKRKKITQKQLALRCNVSYASLCRFEQTGLISHEAFVKLSMELERHLASIGIDRCDISTLDRLAFIGCSGMGALE